MSKSLIVKPPMTASPHLNFDEAVRRIRYWTEEIRRGRQVERAVSALAILSAMMDRHRDTLYLESREKQHAKA